MIEHTTNSNGSVVLSIGQLSDWYKKLKRMENALIIIMKQKRAADKNFFVSEGHDSPRGYSGQQKMPGPAQMG